MSFKTAYTNKGGAAEWLKGVVVHCATNHRNGDLLSKQAAEKINPDAPETVPYSRPWYIEKAREFKERHGVDLPPCTTIPKHTVCEPSPYNPVGLIRDGLPVLLEELTLEYDHSNAEFEALLTNPKKLAEAINSKVYGPTEERL